MADAGSPAVRAAVPVGDLKSRALRDRGRLIALAVLAAMLLGQWGELLPFQERWRAFLFDGYQSIAPRERRSAPVTIVDIDEASLRRLGQWPWPRSLLAQLVERIAASGPAAVGLDILMPEPDRASPCAAVRYVPQVAADHDLIARLCALPSNDALLATALRRASAALTVAGVEHAGDERLRAPPMLAIGADPKPMLRAYVGALTSVAELHDAAAGHAIVSADIDHGILRRVPLAARVGATVMPSLPLEMLRLASKSPGFAIESSDRRIVAVGVGDLRVPTQADSSLWVHYGPTRADRYVSAAAVLDGTVDRDRLQDRLVLVGVSGLGLVDFPVTALRERVPGVEVHAQVLESIFDGTTLLRPRWAHAAESIVFLVLGLALIFGIVRMHSMAEASIVFAAAAALFGVGFWLYARHQLLIDAATPALLFGLLFGGMLTYALMCEQVERRALESSLRSQREAAARTAGEVAAARRIQLGMVPDVKVAFATELRLEIAARMEPARDVGGDLYDCFLLDEHHAFFLVGDVCGKGIPASLFMATSKTLCKSVALRGGVDLRSMMRQANAEIARDNSEMLFVTAFAGILDLHSGELWYANAGHERPYVAVPGHAPVSLDAAGGLPLGIDESMDYPVSRYQLRPEQYLCVVTDGVAEATDAAQHLFGPERLEATLAELSERDDAEAVLKRIFQRVDSFGAGAERSDDVTVLVLRWRGPGVCAGDTVAVA